MRDGEGEGGGISTEYGRKKGLLSLGQKGRKGKEGGKYCR